MELKRYNSLNEKLRICFNCLNDKLTLIEKVEVKQEIKEYKQEMENILKGG